jgi:acyl-CoA thioesterase FadM
MEVRTEIAHEAPYLVFRQKMYFAGTNLKACTGEVKTLFTDKGRLVRDIPRDFLEKFIK